MLDPGQALAALMLGLSGAGHCLGMCGGIAAALSLGGGGNTTNTLAYHGGRIASYTVAGALLGLAAGSITTSGWTLGLRYLAGVLLILMGFYIAEWWRVLAVLERLGAYLWQPVQKVGQRFLSLQNWRGALGLGLCWGLMPCGLIYSALALAATTGNAPGGAAMMLLFGLGTLPAMLATSLGAQQVTDLLRRRGFKLLIAVALIVSGVWTLYITYSHAGHLTAADPGHRHHVH
ncbi:MAG: sulfite exporter TauE/SafE family protein [Halioglobus sp.]|nr:sulfite exporter TauE/SafE family protein [Halioglobus sp.]